MLTLLLVDDRPENLIALEALVSVPERQILKAFSGNEALQIALKTPALDGLLLDVRMPGMDGFETAALLRGSTKTAQLKIAFITADEAQKEVPEKWAALLSPPIFLYKPLEVKVLEALLVAWADSKNMPT